MIDTLPAEIVRHVASFLSQEDKVSLSYVSRTMYDLVIPKLYENLYISAYYYFPCDEPSLGTSYWSVLDFRYLEIAKTGGKIKDYDDERAANRKLATHKFKCLVDTLSSAPMKFCPLIKRVHMTWHVDSDLLLLFVKLLNKYGSSLKSFENFLSKDVMNFLIERQHPLESLTIAPPQVLPEESEVTEEYFITTRSLISHYNFDYLQNLNIPVYACTFFKKLDKPMAIRSLCLNLRPDTYNAEGPNIDGIHYYDIFDVNSLKELEILSWYNNKHIEDVYDLWNLRDFVAFTKIEDFSMFSLRTNNNFLKECLSNYGNLKRIKLDYLDPEVLSIAFLTEIARYDCAKSLTSIDINCEKKEPEPITSTFNFEINIMCKCEKCQETMESVIFKKYIGPHDSRKAVDYYDRERRDFLMQIYKCFPILPHSNLGKYPSIGFDARPLSNFVNNVNGILHRNCNDPKYVTASDVIKLYHLHLHSYRRTFDFFIQNFKASFEIFNLEWTTNKDCGI